MTASPEAPAQSRPEATTTEQAPAPAETSRVLSVNEMEDRLEALPERVDAFVALYSSIGESGSGYASKADFGQMIIAATEKKDAGEAGASLGESYKTVFQYMKSEVARDNTKRIVDITAFERPSIAFPGSPSEVKNAKLEYILDDLTKARNTFAAEYEAMPADAKARAKDHINTLNSMIETVGRYAKDLKGSNQPGGNEVEEYIRLTGDAGVNKDTLKAAATKLDNLAVRNNNEANAYKVISRYFPADANETGPMNTISLNAGIQEMAREAQREAEYAALAEEAKKPGPIQLKRNVKHARANVAQTHAKRQESRRSSLQYKPGYTPNIRHEREKYENNLWESFVKDGGLNGKSDEEIANALSTYVANEADELEAAKNGNIKNRYILRPKKGLAQMKNQELIFSKPTDEYAAELAEFAKELLAELDTEKKEAGKDAGRTVEDWREVFDTFQYSINSYFEERIREERTSSARRLGGRVLRSEGMGQFMDGAKLPFKYTASGVKLPFTYTGKAAKWAKEGTIDRAAAKLSTRAKKTGEKTSSNGNAEDEKTTENKKFKRTRAMGGKALNFVVRGQKTKETKDSKDKASKKRRDGDYAVAAASSAAAATATSVSH